MCVFTYRPTSEDDKACPLLERSIASHPTKNRDRITRASPPIRNLSIRSALSFCWKACLSLGRLFLAAEFVDRLHLFHNNVDVVCHVGLILSELLSRKFS